MEHPAEQVRKDVGEHGYVKLSSLRFDDFNELADRLGAVIRRTSVHAVEPSRSVLNSEAAMPLHTDAPEAVMVGWWCRRSAYPHGASLLIDTAAIAAELDREHLDELTRTPIRQWVAPGQFNLIPCLTVADGGYRVYYTPWFLLDSYSRTQQVALAAFQAFVNRQKPIVVSLREAACLFIDNGRMMHARRAFPASSGRWLERVWIGVGTD